MNRRYEVIFYIVYLYLLLFLFFFTHHGVSCLKWLFEISNCMRRPPFQISSFYERMFQGRTLMR